MAKKPPIKISKKTLTKPSSILPLKAYGYLVLGIAIFLLYYFTLASNTNFRSSKYYLVVPPKTTVVALTEQLSAKGFLMNKYTLKLMARAMNWNHVKPGLYVIKKGWGNVHLISHLQNTPPLKYQQVSVKSYRNRSNIIRNICKQTNLNFKKFYECLNDEPFLQSLDFDKESVYVLFFPQKCPVPLNTTATEVLEVLKSSFDQYWTEEKLENLKNSRLDPIQATVLSTIVYAETKNLFEMPIIAGVYINRLFRGMRLESDPTLVFAKGDFKLQRIYKKHTQTSSNYNTYRKKGLPPGPIGEINLASLDAVVNYTEHDYIFFCANGNLTGTHIYAETYHEHKSNASKYRSALNRRQIK